MKKIDKFDIEILRELIRNSRQPISLLANKLNKSKSFVKYRIERLEKMKVIKKYIVAVRWTLIGFFSFRILAYGIKKINVPKLYGLRWYERFYGGYEFLILSHNNLNIQYLINYLREHGYETDLMVRAKTIIPFNFLGAKVQEFQKKKHIEVDKNKFWNFLVSYEKNLRYPLLKLACELNIDYHKLRSLVKDYEMSIFRGYSIVISPEKLGYKRVAIYLSVINNKDFLGFIQNSNVNNVEKLVGRYDYRVEFYYKNVRTFERFIDKLKDLVRKYKVIKYIE
jgi:DNA-binding Lrp family transcriptional regulator